MDYVQGDLCEYFRKMKNMKKRIPDSEIRFILKGILEGVQALHQNQIMHRDLTPSNVLYDGKGPVKLIDFGLSRPTGTMPESKYT